MARPVNPESPLPHSFIAFVKNPSNMTYKGLFKTSKSLEKKSSVGFSLFSPEAVYNGRVTMTLLLIRTIRRQ